MIMKADVLANSLDANIKTKEKTLYLSPRGKVFNSKLAREFSNEKTINLICGHFEGVDENVPAIISRYTLPVGEAAHVRDFGALMYRLLFLQLNPKEALQFFDEKKLEKARLKASVSGTRPGNPVVRRKIKRKSAKFSLPKKRIYSRQSKTTGTEANLS